MRERGGHVGLGQGFPGSAEQAVHLRPADGGQGNPHGAAPALRRAGEDERPLRLLLLDGEAREPFEGERDAPREIQLDGLRQTALEAAAPAVVVSEADLDVAQNLQRPRLRPADNRALPRCGGSLQRVTGRPGGSPR